MSSKYPALIIALIHNHDAWIVGSAANPDNKDPRDIDIIVPFSQWQSASALIPKDAKVNTFGGWKCQCKINDLTIEVDVWPGDLGWLMQHPQAQWAFHPRSGTRLQKIK